MKIKTIDRIHIRLLAIALAVALAFFAFSSQIAFAADPPEITYFGSQRVAGAHIEIHISGFTLGTKVFFGNAEANMWMSSGNMFYYTIPPGTGMIEVTAQNENGTSQPRIFIYDGTPYIERVTPNTSDLTGGTPITISGGNFTGVISVSVDGVAATNVVQVGNNTITCNTPALTPTPVSGSLHDIVVTSGSLNSNAYALNYTSSSALQPIITGVSPDHCSIAGGSTVTITGTNLNDVSDIFFGGEPATNITIVSAGTELTCTAPPHTAGLVDVSATNPDGTGTFPLCFMYTDITPPTLLPGAVSRTSDTEATVKFTSDQSGQYYCEIVDSGAPRPTIDTSGAGTYCGTTEVTIVNPAGLAEGAKDIYIIVKNAVGDVSSKTFHIAIPAYVPLSLTMTPVKTMLTVGAEANGQLVATASVTGFSGAVAYSIDGASTLPEGLGVDSTTGEISVTDASALAATTATTVTVKAVYGTEIATDTVMITVNAVPPSTHSVTLNQATGGTAIATPTTAAAGDMISLSISSLEQYYSFVCWDVSPTVTWTGGNELLENTSFIMPDADVIIMPVYAYNPPPNTYSGGNSWSPPVILYPVEVTVRPNMPTIAQLTIYRESDRECPSRFTVTKEMVQRALDEAKKEEKKLGNEEYGYVLEFNTCKPGCDCFNCATINLTAQALALLESTGVRETSAVSCKFRFSIDLAAIKQLNSQSGGRSVTVTATRFSKLSDAAKKLIDSRPAWDVSIGFKKNGKAFNITNLGKGVMTMGMKYAPVSGEKIGNLAVIYVPGSGKPQILTNSSYENGWLNWQRSSLSVYGVGYITPAPAFTDTQSHWAKDSIDFVVVRGLLTGTSNTTFSPDIAVTRAMFITALGRLSCTDVSGYKTSSFTDVSAGSYYLPYVEWAAANKIVSGTGGGRFSPDSAITREGMTVMMQNYAKATGYKIPASREKITFADASSISSYAKDAVTAMQQAGIIVGCGNNTFAPKANATRAETATILRCFVELVIDEGTARGWSRNDTGQWQYITEYGKLKTGWLSITSDEKYYFDANGVMISGKWLQSDGKQYYFYLDGKLAADTTIDGHKVGPDGARQ